MYVHRCNAEILSAIPQRAQADLCRELEEPRQRVCDDRLSLRNALCMCIAVRLYMYVCVHVYELRRQIALETCG